MFKVAFRVGLQLLLSTAPLFTMSWSLLDWLGYSPLGPQHQVTISGFGRVFIQGPKDHVEFQLRAICTTLGLALLFGYEAAEFYVPKRNLQQFRQEYLVHESAEWRQRLGPEIRINLMFVKRSILLFPLRRFAWIWNDGFQPHHRDVNMTMMAWQGVCGRALRTRRPQSAYFSESDFQSLSFSQKWLFGTEFKLWGPQFRRTRHLRGVISIPIIRASTELSPTYEAVGVLNLDTSTEAGAGLLKKNEIELAEYFHRFGKILAALNG